MSQEKVRISLRYEQVTQISSATAHTTIYYSVLHRLKRANPKECCVPADLLQTPTESAVFSAISGKLDSCHSFDNKS